jgi:hypothetical protein
LERAPGRGKAPSSAAHLRTAAFPGTEHAKIRLHATDWFSQILKGVSFGILLFFLAAGLTLYVQQVVESSIRM